MDAKNGRFSVRGEDVGDKGPTLAKGLDIGVTGLDGEKGDREVREEAMEAENKESEEEEDEEDDEGMPEQLTLCLKRGGLCPLLALLNLCSSALWIK